MGAYFSRKKQGEGIKHFVPVCSLEEWQKLISKPHIEQVNLYTCSRAKESVPVGVSLATRFQIVALKGWVDKITSAFEGYKCKGVKWTEKKKNKWIRSLMKSFGISPTTVPGCETMTIAECAKKFPTVNDFFTRGIQPENEMTKESDQISWAKDEQGKLSPVLLQQDVKNKILMSPAECYCVMFPTASVAQKWWIKGNRFSISALLGNSEQGLYDDAITIVCRLTPKHYHRFHVPISGTIVKVSKLGSRELSVQRNVVNNPLTNVYTENIRHILYIDTIYFGIIAMIIVGATCVSSIRYFNKTLDNLMQKQTIPTVSFPIEPIHATNQSQLGKFLYGGSTIVLLIPKSPDNYILSRILLASQRKVETEVAPGQPLVFYSA